MSRASGKQAKFLLTKLLTGAGATAVFVALWAAVAATGSAGKQANDSAQVEDESAPIEQDGWRWDAATNQWVAIAEPAAVAVAPMEQIVVVERQPVYYYVRYVIEQPPAPGPVGAATSRPAAMATANGTGAAGAGISGAPAEVPTAVPPSATLDASAVPDATLPSPAAPAPAAPAPAPPVAAAPVVAARPAPPAPAPAAPRKTKGS